MPTMISSTAVNPNWHYLFGILLLAAAVPFIAFLLRFVMARTVSTTPEPLRQGVLGVTLRGQFAYSAESIAFLATCIAATLPVWAAAFPPMTDLPQHAAQISLFYALQDPAFTFADLFTVNLFTPYLFGYGVIAALVPLAGIVVACKIAISLAIAATPLATRFLLRQAGADPYLAWLSFPALYGFVYQWGFVNFLIAAPLGLLVLGFIWRQAERPSLRTSILTALLFNFLFFCHALALALFASIAALFWISRARSLKVFLAHAWPLATVALPAIAWIISRNSHPAVAEPNSWDLNWFSTVESYYGYIASWTGEGFAAWGRVNGLFPRLFGMRSEALSLALGISIAVLPFAIARFRFSLQRSLALIVCLFVLLLVPSYVFGVAYVFHRFTQYLLPFYLLLFIPLADNSVSFARRSTKVLGPAIALFVIGMMTYRALDFDQEARNFERAVSYMQEEKRALSLVFLREDNASIAPTFLHFPAWYSAMKRGVVDKSFAVSQVTPVAYRPGAVPGSGIDGSEWWPEGFSWAGMRGSQYDYFIVRAEADYGPTLFRAAKCPPQLISHFGTWWVYQRSDRNCS